MSDEYQTALRKASLAYYKYSDLDQYVQYAEQRYTPQWVREYGGVLAAVATVTLEKRITLKWSFE